MKRSWARRTAELHGEIAAIAEPDLRWWLLAGGVAAVEPWGAEADLYVRSDAGPGEDTFLGMRTPAARDPIAHAIARAVAARCAMRELDGLLPDQTLAVTIQRTENPEDSGLARSALDIAAFAIGSECLVMAIDDPALPDALLQFVHGMSPPRWRGPTPFVCVSLGDDPIATARHGHRRAWRGGSGPWLGLGRSGELETVSTCHLVVDGYGHARLTARIAELAVAERASAEPTLPMLAPVDGGIPLGIAWRELAGRAPHALRLAYGLGRVLHRAMGRRDARFSPTFQIPIAPGERTDPLRIRRRGTPGIVSVRFDAGVPEPFASFEARARDVLAREAAGQGLCSRLLAAARGAPAPLAWKRRGISATRPRWLDRISDVIGGRACLSKIRLDTHLAPVCAVSSPARLVTESDKIGGCVITVVDDGTQAAITACGSGLAGSTAAANDLLDELLAIL